MVKERERRIGWDAIIRNKHSLILHATMKSRAKGKEKKVLLHCVIFGSITNNICKLKYIYYGPRNKYGTHSRVLLKSLDIRPKVQIILQV